MEFHVRPVNARVGSSDQELGFEVKHGSGEQHFPAGTTGGRNSMGFARGADARAGGIKALSNGVLLLRAWDRPPSQPRRAPETPEVCTPAREAAYVPSVFLSSGEPPRQEAW